MAINREELESSKSAKFVNPIKQVPSSEERLFACYENGIQFHDTIHMNNISMIV